MGISFKVSKTGRRFRPKPLPLSDNNSVAEDHATFLDNPKDSSRRILGGRNDSSSVATRKSQVDTNDRDIDATAEAEVSFTVSLFPDGYSIGKPSEGESVNQTFAEVPKLLHPYDRASETLFSALEAGRLPGDILDDIPCKYINGMLVCEVRDYRKCFSEAGANLPSTAGSPIINRVHLRMSLENVVKDIPSFSDGAWTYGDLMEVESRILKALQPKLCLDPTPKLDRLSDDRTASKLNLAICNMRKRLRQIPEVTVTSHNNIQGKKVCIDRAPESSRLGDSGPVLPQPIHETLQTQNNGPNNMIALRSNSFGVNASVPSSHLASQPSKYQMVVGSPRIMQDQRRDNQDGLSNSNKRSTHNSVGAYGNQQQHVGSPMDSFQGQDSHWKNTILQQPSLSRGMQYGNSGLQKYPLQMFEGVLDQEAGSLPFTQGIRYGLKEEPIETERLDKPEIAQTRNEVHGLESELNQADSQQSRLSQRIPQQFMRSTFPQTPWNNIGQPLDSNSRKEDPFQKRKLVQSPRVSAGGIPQSSLSSKSGEFSSGSVGPQVGAAVTSGYLPSQKEKSVNTSVPPTGGGTSLTSSANDSMQRQQQAQIAAKRRSNSLPRTPVMSGVGSPASVNNMSMPINVSSPPVGTPLADPVMIDRFSKIDMVTARFQLNRKKNKVDEYPVRKIFSAQQLSVHLSSEANNENFKDDSCKMPLSTSVVGGSMNICKTRVINFILTEGTVQGNAFPMVPKARTRLIMSEKPNDGTVAIHIGDIEYAQYLAAEDYLPTLPNTHTADLLAAQFSSLMIREGYDVEDHVQPKPVPPIHAASNQPNVPGGPPYNPTAEMPHYSEAVSVQPSNDIKPSINGTQSLNQSNNLQGTRMLGPGNVQGMHISLSQAFLSGVSVPTRPQQSEALPSMQQPQNQHQFMQQHPQFQRSSIALAANPMLNSIGQNSNMQLGNLMGKQPSPLQLQILQQQQQQQQHLQPLQPQQQPHMQRKMIMNLGNVGVGNNVVGLGGLGNVMGMGGVRGVGGMGISAPMASIAAMGNIGQIPLNISNAFSQQLRSGANNPFNTMLKMRMGQNRGNMPAGPQSGFSSIAGARQMNDAAGLSGLGPVPNRGNFNPIQRTVGQMGPPKLMSGMNPYMTQQQLPLQQQQQQQQPPQQQVQQQTQLPQQLQQQQENTSPLQAVVSPLVGSPSNMGMAQQGNQQTNQQQPQQQQQQASPQPMNQRTPMSPQLSSGAVHTMSTGNQEACPASPQLSSQTLGSIGSITNSPMELQGVHKSN